MQSFTLIGKGIWKICLLVHAENTYTMVLFNKESIRVSFHWFVKPAKIQFFATYPHWRSMGESREKDRCILTKPLIIPSKIPRNSSYTKGDVQMSGGSEQSCLFPKWDAISPKCIGCSKKLSRLVFLCCLGKKALPRYIW